MARSASLSFESGMRFRARVREHELVLDASPSVGGGDAAPSPMDLQLLAVAGCAAMDVVSILRKMREEVTSYDVDVSGETEEEHPRRYHSIAIVHRFAGPALGEDSVRRAIFLSMSRYCPVYSMIAPTVDVRQHYEVRGEAGELVATGEVMVAGDVHV